MDEGERSFSGFLKKPADNLQLSLEKSPRQDSKPILPASLPPPEKPRSGPDCNKHERHACQDINDVVVSKVNGTDNEQHSHDEKYPTKLEMELKGNIKGDQCHLRVSARKGVSLSVSNRIGSVIWDRLTCVDKVSYPMRKPDPRQFSVKVREIV